jgi:NADP-dependent 3-hydroxy acid dehydrogenase YdfG
LHKDRAMPVALITGCSSGIGRALADVFKAAGYTVWASARKPEDVAALPPPVSPPCNWTSTMARRSNS